jgi:hypothetical protein
MKSRLTIVVLSALAVVPPVASAQNGGAAASGANGNSAPAYGQLVMTMPPGDPFSAVAPANAAAAGARVRLENARDQISDLVRIERMLFENSAAYTQALGARDAAYATFDTARQSVLAALDSDPEARQTRLLVEDAAKQIEVQRARIGARIAQGGSAASPAETAHLEALIDYRLSLAQSLRKMETDALASDKAYQEARSALLSATARVDDLKRNFELRLRSGEQLASARTEMRNAREASAAASAYADQTARTADILLDYAYYVQWTLRRRPYVVSSTVLTYGYPTYYSGGVVAPVESTGIGYGYVPYQGQ